MLVFTYQIRPLVNNSFSIHFALYNRKPRKRINFLLNRSLTIECSELDKIANYLEDYTERTFEDIQENFDKDTGVLQIFASKPRV
ncbi:hypothetical protein EST38_g7746 [Candolleomyces aberdarensis]|uniref:Uncharacterized protein n=1 Tax=Candolleomyces aberdarensis TaxID=2316362 RepID=A0A4Q2DED2_9AGAR|nr:hypothetical protein EST38_g7746 [Candolleomyces aberdarensis]